MFQGLGILMVAGKSGAPQTFGALIDSYSETNQDSTQNINAAAVDNNGVGQSFLGNGLTLGSCRFYISKVGNPTGTCVAQIERMTGGLGTDPTGVILATSATMDVSTIPTSFSLIAFRFSGAQQIVLTNATAYAVGLFYTGGDASNLIAIGTDASAPTHAGTLCYWDSAHTQGRAFPSQDTCFYVNDNTG